MAGPSRFGAAQFPRRASGPRRSRRSRPRGFTLIELVITIAIFSAIAALAAWGGKGVIPMWQTRAMAYKLQSDLVKCRALALQNGNYCRVKLTGETSTSWSNTKVGAGKWQVQYCNTRSGDIYEDGSCWDTLPIDAPDTSFTLKGEGTIDMGDKNNDYYAKWTSINGFGGLDNAQQDLQWMTISANDDAIVFDYRGRCVNPSTNYGEPDAGNRIYVNVVNKFRKETDGVMECYTVKVGRTGVESGIITMGKTSGTSCPNTY